MSAPPIVKEGNLHETTTSGRTGKNKENPQDALDVGELPSYDGCRTLTTVSASGRVRDYYQSL